MGAALRALCSLLVTFAAASITKYELLDYDSEADSTAVHADSSGKARFTVLTDRLIRMEFSADGAFEDRPSLAVVNRRLPVPAHTAGETGGVLSINTSSLRLTYQAGLPFGAESLVVVAAAEEEDGEPGGFSRWDGGMTSAADSGNLLGTFRTLDQTNNVSLNCTLTGGQGACDGGSCGHCELGLVSRSGWAVVNDSATPILDAANDHWSSDNGTALPRRGGTDLYLFAHGLDFKGAFKDFASVGGKMPMVPRYISGVWYTRWYDYSFADARKVVDDYESRGLPLDVWVYDMNWHKKNGWTGFTLDDNLFPMPDDMLAWFADQGLHVSGNLHDADGIAAFEAQYARMAQAVGQPANGSTIACDLNSRAYAEGLEDQVLLPLEEAGFSFWWIDWQQGEQGCGLSGGKRNPTIWLNKMRSTSPRRRKIQGGTDRRGAKRGVLFGRFGGLGNHRYQVGFSGDVKQVTWSNLAYQPYFTATAANVLFSMWSHDVVGPGGGSSDDYELFVRWVQWASMSGVMRSHDRGMSAGGCYASHFPTVEGSCPSVEPFNAPRRYFEANRAALRGRAALLPYIYTAMRTAHDDGVPLVRPLYHDFPREEMAYASDSAGNFAQYMFGPDLMVAPVVVGSSADAAMANVTFWLPPGGWVERHSGDVAVAAAGGRVVTKLFDLEELPVYVRAGAIVPEKPCCDRLVGGAASPLDHLVLKVYPGAASGETTVYEDDGLTDRYLDAAHASWTRVSYTRNSTAAAVGDAAAETLTVVVSAPSVPAVAPASRRVTVRLVNHLAPASVRVGARQLPFSRWGGDETWSYDGDAMELVVECGLLPATSPVQVVVVAPAADAVSGGAVGVRGLVRHALLAKRNLDEVRATPHSTTGKQGYAGLTRLAGLGDVLSAVANEPAAFARALANTTALLKAALDDLAAMQPPPEGSLVGLWDSGRRDHLLCGTDACESSNTGYERVRIEGYQPAETHPDAVPLRAFWDAARADNYQTPDPATVPAGYKPAVFADGRVLSAAAAAGGLKGLAPLSLYFNSAWNDHMAVATAAGRAYAEANGYELLNKTAGYVFEEPPQLGGLRGVDVHRLDYSVQLLNNAGLAPARWHAPLRTLAAAGSSPRGATARAVRSSLTPWP